MDIQQKGEKRKHKQLWDLEVSQRLLLTDFLRLFGLKRENSSLRRPYNNLVRKDKPDQISIELLSTIFEEIGDEFHKDY